MPELDHVVFSVEPDDEAPAPLPGKPVAVLVRAELGFDGSEDVVAVTDRAAELDPVRPAEPQILDLLGEELLGELADQASEAGVVVTRDELRPHLKIVFAFGADELFPDE